jgi:hypothetical protein
MRRIVGLGVAIWLGATVLLRVAGQFIVPGKAWAIVALFVASFPAMALVARLACRPLPKNEWPLGAMALAAPTLLLDPFTSAFFAQVFPNIGPERAGVFGGWMLCCVAGALYGGAHK